MAFAMVEMNMRHSNVIALLLGAFLIGILDGCDSVYGPAFFNDSDQVVRITARFSTGPLEFSLKPHQSVVQIASGHVLETLVVASDGHREEFGEDRLQSVLRGVAQDDALLLMHPDSIKVCSLHEAMREGLFTKPQQ